MVVSHRLKDLGDFSRKVEGNVLQLDQVMGVVRGHSTGGTHRLVICLAEGVDL